jgi:hypothetical protein
VLPKKQDHSPARPGGLSEAGLDRLFLIVLFVLPFILYREFLTGSKMIFGSDFIGSGSFAMRQFMADYVSHHGAFAMWVPYLYSGMPTVASFFADMFYPFSVLLRLLMPVHVAWTYTFILQIFVAGLGTYLFLKRLKVPKTVAFVLAIAYMFCGSVVSNTHEGHDGRLIVESLLPMVLYFLERGIESGRLIDFLLSGTMLGLQLLSGHLQETYYTGMIAIIYFVFRFITRVHDDRKAGIRTGARLRLIWLFVVMLVFMGCLAAIQYLPVYGNLAAGVRGGSRGYAFASSWSMPPEETFDLITAKFSGGLDHYWGRNPFKHHTEYLGILPLILALVALVFCWRERIVKFFFGLFCFALLMAWGGHTPFYYIPYYLFPGTGKFRAPSLIFFVAAFSVVVLAAFGLKYLMAHRGDGVPKSTGKAGTPADRRLSRFMLWTGGVGVGLLIIFAVGQGAIVSLLSAISHSEASRIADNYSNFLGGMVLATVLILVNLALIYALVRMKLKPLFFAGLAGLVLVGDLWLVDSQFIKPYPPPAESFKADDVITFLKKDPDHFRVLPLYYTDPQTGMNKSDEGILMVNGIENVGGQHPNPLQNYMDFVGLDNTVMFNLPPNLANRKFLDLLNVKYIISVPLPSDVSRYPADQQQVIQSLRQYVNQPGISVAWQSPQAIVYRNDSMLPRAFLVPGYEVASGKEKVIARIKDPGFDPSRTVLLAEDPGVMLPGDKPIQGSAEVKSYDADKIVVEASLDRPGFLVMSENYHPDWKAKDNGRPVKILRAYHTLRAVYLEAGSHTLEFRYDSKYVKAGTLLSLLAVALLALVGLVSIIRARRPRRPVQTTGPVLTRPG